MIHRVFVILACTLAIGCGDDEPTIVGDPGMRASAFGQVTDHNGNPVSSTGVSARGPFNILGETSTNSEGAYILAMFGGLGTEGDFSVVIVATPPPATGLAADSVSIPSVHFSASPSNADSLRVDFVLQPLDGG